MSSRLRVVIVNFRTADLVVDCLRSIAEEGIDVAQLSVVVVDNDSADGSFESLTTSLRTWGWTSLMPAGRNGGFAFGNNLAIRDALQSPERPDYFLFLNPDTIVCPGAILALLDFMQLHPRAGVAGSSLENLNGEIERSAHNAPSPLGELESSARLGPLSRLLRNRAVSPPAQRAPHRCDWVSGASLMVRRRVLEDIGLFDEGFFLYFEEVDLCVRARRAGWEVWFVPESRIVHLEGASTGIRQSSRRPVYWYESRRRYMVKHFGVGGLIAADLLWALGRASLAVRRMLGLARGRYSQDPKRMAFDLLLGDLRSLFDGRAWSIRRHADSR